MFPFLTDKRVSDKLPFYTDKQTTDEFLIFTDKLPPPLKFFPKPPLPALAKFPKEMRNNKQKKDAEKFSVFFLVAGEGLEPPASGL